MNYKKIAVLLSTYNGEKYVDELIESILNQSYTHFHIFIRDDNSTDSTYQKLEDHYKNNRNITLLKASHNIGANLSFSELISIALKDNEYDFFMFADQDDVWLKDKIMISYKLICQSNEQIPALAHTDMYITDENLKVLSKSLWKYQSINPENCSFNRLLIQNVITGCSTIVNKALAIKAAPIPNDSIMHDWWLGLLASSLGEINYSKQPTLYYRQHNFNTIGAKKFNIKYILMNIFKRKSFYENIIQAKAFRREYGNEIDNNKRLMLDALCSLDKVNYFQRLLLIFKYRFFKVGLIRNISFIINLFNLKVVGRKH